MNTCPDKRNGFTLIRILSATLVLFTHCYVVLGYNHGDILERNGYIGLSKIGLDTFFVISGFLVTQSLFRSDNMSIFIAKRAARLLPALVILILITVFIVGPILSTSPSYFSSPETWKYLSLSFIFSSSRVLPGVFEGNPVDVVNGSLWSLPLEVTCYAVISILFAMRVLNKKNLSILLLVMLTLHLNDTFNREYLYLYIQTILANELGYLFLFGSFLSLFKINNNFNSMLIAAPILIILIGFVFYGGNWHRYAFFYLLLWPITIILICIKLTRFDWLNKYDISYGVYIYGFLCQQILVTYFPNINSVTLFFIASVLFSYSAGYLSWVFIEKPTIKLCKNMLSGTPKQTSASTIK
ncbi:Acyltransferase family protein [compost metagenome]